MQYFELVRHAFKRFSVVRARKTLLPTLLHYAHRNPLPKSDKPALFTMNICPPAMTVWYHFARKALGHEVDITIFDCSGELDAKEFPGARVQKFLNFYAATKTDEFLYHIARNRRIGWMCDDDIFLQSPRCLEILKREFSKPNTASVSFRPRLWWTMDIDGKSYQPSSSYCTAINREIYCNKEQLKLGPADGNPHKGTENNKDPGRYDTFDLANETLLRKGYNCYIATEEEQEECITGFNNMSSAVMLLWYFQSSQDTLDWFLSPPKEQWKGNILYQAFSGMLAISALCDLYEKIQGKPYVLQSLPSKDELQRVREEHEGLLGRERGFGHIDEVEERLRRNL